MTEDWRIGDAVLAILFGFLAGAVGFAVVGTVDPTPLQTFGIILPMQEVGSLVAFWMLSRKRGIEDPLASLGIPPRWDEAWLILVGVLLAVIATISLTLLVDTEEAPQEIARIAQEASGLAAILAFGGTVLLAPVTEEIIFRGVLLRGLQRHLPFLGAAAVSSFAFAGFHYGGPDTLVVLLPLFLLGMILSVVARRFKVGAAIYVHSGFNLLAAVSFFL